MRAASDGSTSSRARSIRPTTARSQKASARFRKRSIATGRSSAQPCAGFDVDATVRLFEEAGVATKIEANGKIFPVSDKAVDVLDAARAPRSSGRAPLALLQPCGPGRHAANPRTSKAKSRGYRRPAADSTVTARRVIVAVGGASYPGCGTTGDGYAIARRFGHTIVEPRPALVPLRSPDLGPGLKGLTLPDVVASVHDSSGTTLAKRREALLFAHFGLTGPAILDVSRAVGSARRSRAVDGCGWISSPTGPSKRLIWSSSRRAGRVVEPSQRSCRMRFRDDLPSACSRSQAIPADRNGPELSREERQPARGDAQGA